MRVDMLETLVMDRSLDKKSLKKRHKILRDQFFDLAHATWQSNIPVLVILEGWDLAGKGACIEFMTKRQDPRGIQTEYFAEARSHEKQRPWMHRFWLKLPKHGRISIWDTSWYRRVLSERVNHRIENGEVETAWQDIVKTERMLALDGMVIVKFLLHITKEEQHKRLKKFEKHPVPGFRITESEWGLHRQYDELLVAAEEMLVQTDTGLAPWNLIPANDLEFAQATVFETLIDRLKRVLQDRHISFVQENATDDSSGD